MLGYIFTTYTSIQYFDTGKFESPSPDWCHLTIGLNNYELIIMTRGNLYIEYLGVKYCLSPNDFLLLPPSADGLRKGYKPSDCSFYWLHFISPGEVRSVELLPLSSGSLPEENEICIPSQGTLSHPEKIIVLLRLLQDYARSDYSVTAKNYLSTLILCEMDFQYTVMADNIRNKLSSHPVEKQLYNDILDYIKDHIHSNIKVSEIAAHFGYNSKYLSNAFKNVIGITLKKYITNTKMAEAALLLSDTNLDIKEIASNLGYTDSHNFMKIFKREMGVSPSEYRNRCSKRIINHI